MDKERCSNIYKWNSYLIFIFFAAIAFAWLYFENRYHIICYHEETQLFRTDIFYFSEYMSRPAGLISYLGAFFTQFYYYPCLGALILALFVSLTYLVFAAICRKINTNIDLLFILPLAVSLLLLMSCSYIHFRQVNVLGICFSLLLFLVYLFFKGKIRYAGGFFLYLMSYLVSGGNAFLFVCLVSVHELFNKDRAYLYIVGLAIAALFTPYAASKTIYIASVKSLYFSGTPFDLPVDIKEYIVAWVGIPAIYLLWKVLGKYAVIKGRTQMLLLSSISYVLTLFFTYSGLNSVTDRDEETLSYMAYNIERSDWQKVLKAGKAHDFGQVNPLAIYFTNIALSESGELSSRMFHYNQIGTVGLFVPWSMQYFMPMYNGELYYHLGIIQEAEHSAYESMIATWCGYGSKNLRRLLNVAMLKRDHAGFEKYITLFEKSPVYANWAKEQRGYFDLLMSDTLYEIPQTPEKLEHSNFIIDYNFPENNLMQILKDNPHNNKIFEYLAAAILLAKDVKTFLYIFNEYYPRMQHDSIPRHYEEALLICRSLLKNEADLEILKKYTVSESTFADFVEYGKLIRQLNAQKSIDDFNKRFEKTYWYYFQYATPVSLSQSVAPDRY